MRNFIVIASILATASLAHAEPIAASISSSTTPSLAPATYVAAGISFGGVDGHDAAGASVELGQRIWRNVSLHALAAGAADGALFDGQGSYLQFRGGFDLSSCATVQKICAYVGADAGYAQDRYSTWSFDGNMSSYGNGAIGVLRAGLDVGNKHVRWRPGFEATVVGGSSGALTQSIAFRF